MNIIYNGITIRELAPAFKVAKINNAGELALHINASSLEQFDGMKGWLDEQHVTLNDCNPYNVQRTPLDDVLFTARITPQQATFLKIRWGGAQ